MFRSIPLLTTVLGSALFFASEAQPVFAQWDPWLLGPRYQTSYYGGSSFYGGYWTGYAPASAYNNCCYGPVPACDCGCPTGCSPCNGGNCASGNCSLNAAPPGSPKPIADPENERRVPGRTNPNRTFDQNDNRNFETPNRTGTGSNLEDAPPPKFRPGTGTGSGTKLPEDDFGPRPGGRGTGSGTGTGLDSNSDPFPSRTNKPELQNDPDLPNVPDRVPASPANVKEEAPLDADLGLELKMTSRPVLIRERQSLQSRFATPSVVRAQSRPRSEWSTAPQTARIARQ